MRNTVVVRRCDLCGDTYFRRNLMEGWTSQNPGHRIGWIKTRRRICTKCMNADRAQKLMVLANVRLVGRIGKALRKKVKVLR